MNIDLTDEVEKRFISTKFVFEKSFTTSKRIEILKEILDQEEIRLGCLEVQKNGQMMTFTKEQA